MKIRPLFRRYQKYLLAFANTSVGKAYLGIKTNDRIVKLAPDGWHVQKDKGIYQATFHPRSPYLKKFRLALESMAIVEEAGFKFKQLTRGLDFVVPEYLGLTPHKVYLPLLLLDSLTVSPDADPETTTVDGHVYKNDSADWATTRGAADGSVASATDANVESGTQHTGTVYRINRFFSLFDTSTITTGANVTAATFTVGVFAADSPGDNDAQTYMALVGPTNPASNTNLVTGDYDQTSDTAVAATKALSTLTDGRYDFALTDLTVVTKAGITKLGTREGHDHANSAIAGSALNRIGVNTADLGGGSAPVLVVTYTLPVAGGSYAFFM